jgi:hypothetical protein
VNYAAQDQNIMLLLRVLLKPLTVQTPRKSIIETSKIKHLSSALRNAQNIQNQPIVPLGPLNILIRKSAWSSP